MNTYEASASVLYHFLLCITSYVEGSGSPAKCLSFSYIAPFLIYHPSDPFNKHPRVSLRAARAQVPSWTAEACFP